MPPPAVMEVNWVPPTSASCGADNGSGVPPTPRPKFVKARRPTRSRTSSTDRQSSACDSSRSVPTGAGKLETADSSGFPENNGKDRSGFVISVEVGSFSEHATVSSNGNAGTFGLKLNSLVNHTEREASSSFVFGSSQFRPASTLNTERIISNGFHEQFGKLNLSDNLKVKIDTAAGSQEVKNNDEMFNSHIGESLNSTEGLASGAFVFTGNSQNSSVHGKLRGRRSSNPVRSKRVSVNKGSAFRKSQNDAEASQPFYGNSSTASVEHIRNPNDAIENASKSKMVDENISIFESNGKLSSQSAGVSSSYPSVFKENNDPPFLKTNLFSKPMSSDFTEKSCTAEHNILSADELSAGKQHLPEEINIEENSSTSNCYSPMDFSPYQERGVDHQSSLENETKEQVRSNCVPGMSRFTESTSVEFGVSSSSGDRPDNAASGSTHTSASSGTENPACQPESNRFCNNSMVGNEVKFCFSSCSEKPDQGGFVFCASGSNKGSSFKGKHRPGSGNVEPNAASSSTAQCANLEDTSSSIRGQSGCTFDNECLSKQASRGEPVISRKSRPRLVKLRKHSHGRSKARSTQEKDPICDPSSAVPDGLFQVRLNYADSSTSDNAASQEVNCSSFVFGKGMGSMNSTNCGKERTGSQGADNGVFIFKGSTNQSSKCSESSAAESNHYTKPSGENFGSMSDTSSSGKHGLDGDCKEESNLSFKLSDCMHKLNIRDVENAGGDPRDGALGPDESPFVFRSSTEAFGINADRFPSSSSDQIKNPNTRVCDGVENGNNIRIIGEDHVMFGDREGVSSDSIGNGPYSNKGVFKCRDSDANLPKPEETPSQFSSAFGVEKENQGGFVFCASTSVGVNSPRRKRLQKKRNSIQTPVTFVIHPDPNSSTTLPCEKFSDPRGEVAHEHENEDKSRLSGQETCEQKEVSSSASIQEACEKWRFRGNQAYKNGHFTRAERFYTKGIDSVPSHETSGCCLKPLLLCYSNRAATLMSVGRLREAIADCGRAAELDPNFVKVQIRKANCYLVLGEIEKAIICFNKCLESGANVCLDRRLVIEAAEGLQRAQKVAEHIKIATKLLEEKNSDAESRALEIISEAMSISKFSEILLQMKAEALYMSRKYEEVIQLCEQSLVVAEKNLVASDVPKGSENLDGSKIDGKVKIKLWRLFLMAKSNFCMGRLEEALDLLQKVETSGCTSVKSLSEYMASTSLLSSTIQKLLDFKNSGNEAFRSKKYVEAVEHYTAALSSSSESRPFAAICFCNRAAAHQALGQIADAIADCSLAIALDGNYAKAVSRRATLHELIRHYEQAANDDNRLISILQNQSNQKTKASGGPSDRASELRKAHKHKSSMEEEAKKETPLDFYLILGVKKSDTAADIKKAYRKAALRHHPDKAGQSLNGCEGWLWKEIAEVVHEDADRLFKIIGEAYAVLSDASKRAQYDLEEEIRKTPKESSVYGSHYRNASYDNYGFPSRRNSSRYYTQENWKTYGNSHSRW